MTEPKVKNRITKGLFEQSDGGDKVDVPSLVKARPKKEHAPTHQQEPNQPPRTSDELAQSTASSLANVSGAEDQKKQQDADEANKFSEEDINMVKDSIFKGFCTHTEEVPIFPGYNLRIKLMSMCTNEYDFISQIVFDYKKETADKEGYPKICQEKFESLFSGLLLALQVASMDGKPIVNNERDLNNIKIAVKSFSRLELLGIYDETKAIELTELKKELVNRAFTFMELENNVQTIINTTRANFNNKISELLSQDALIKK